MWAAAYLDVKSRLSGIITHVYYHLTQNYKILTIHHQENQENKNETKNVCMWDYIVQYN